MQCLRQQKISAKENWENNRTFSVSLQNGGCENEKEQKQICSLELLLTLEKLPELNGNEGREQIRKFFKKFSLAIEEWPEKHRILALECKVNGKAERAFSAATANRPVNFDAVRIEMESLLDEWDCTAIRAFKELWDGPKKRPDENLEEFAERLYQLVQCAYPGLPLHLYGDYAAKHFIRALENAKMSIELEMARRSDLSYDSLVALAVRAEAAQKAAKPIEEDENAHLAHSHKPIYAEKATTDWKKFSRGTNKILCYKCLKIGHIARNCKAKFSWKECGFEQNKPNMNFQKKTQGLGPKISREEKTSQKSSPLKRVKDGRNKRNLSQKTVESTDVPTIFAGLFAVFLVVANAFSNVKAKTHGRRFSSTANCSPKLPALWNPLNVGFKKLWKKENSKENGINNKVKATNGNGQLRTIDFSKAGEELADATGPTTKFLKSGTERKLSAVGGTITNKAASSHTIRSNYDVGLCHC